MQSHQVPLHLSVFMDTGSGLKELLASADGRSQAIAQIVIPRIAPASRPRTPVSPS